MTRRRPAPLPPGRQPYDPLNGLRVGGFFGALLGAPFLVFLGGTGVWFLISGAVLGGAAGYLSERRRLRPPP